MADQWRVLAILALVEAGAPTPKSQPVDRKGIYTERMAIFRQRQVAMSGVKAIDSFI